MNSANLFEFCPVSCFVECDSFSGSHRTHPCRGAVASRQILPICRLFFLRPRAAQANMTATRSTGAARRAGPATICASWPGGVRPSGIFAVLILRNWPRSILDSFACGMPGASAACCWLHGWLSMISDYKLRFDKHFLRVCHAQSGVNAAGGFFHFNHLRHSSSFSWGGVVRPVRAFADSSKSRCSVSGRFLSSAGSCVSNP